MAQKKEDLPGWLVLTVEADPVAHEAISAFLFDLGCTGVAFEQGGPRTISAYLPAKEPIQDIKRKVEAFLMDLSTIFPHMTTPTLNLTLLKEKDWSQGWKRFFQEEWVTDQLLIVPAWKRIPEISKGHVLIMDPGPAFGTGKHPTTRMCLRAMERAEKPSPWHMLDVGTGSGILAIYAARLGAERILGIDIDPEAIRWARRNAELNRLSNRIEISGKALNEISEQFDLVAANLVYEEIMGLMFHLISVTKEGGTLILSGLLRDQVSDVVQAAQQKGLVVEGTDFMDEWCTIVGRPKAGGKVRQ